MYLINCVGEASSTAHFSFMYFLSSTRRWTIEQPNMS